MTSYFVLASTTLASSLLLSFYLLLLTSLLRDRGKEVTLLSFRDPKDDLEGFLQTGTNLELVEDWEWRFRRKKDDDLLSCDDLWTLSLTSEYLNSGWTKSVSKAQFDGQSVAVKTVNFDGRQFSDCLKRKPSISDCHTESVQKLLKEMALLHQLEHANVVKLVGYCIPKDPYQMPSDDSPLRISIITEYGQPADIIKFLQLDWEERLKRLHSISNLLYYLSKSPFGSISIGDFRRQQFITGSDDQLKIVDVDDFGLTEPKCTTDFECCEKFTGRFGLNCTNDKKLSCKMGFCRGFNEFHNLFHTNRVFFTELLPHGIPRDLSTKGQKLLENMLELKLNSEQLQKDIQQLAIQHRSQPVKDNFVSKSYFHMVPNSDLPYMHDYTCKGSRSHISCTLSVSSLTDAQQLCLGQQSCRAFVWTGDRTWTGRPIVHFKTNSTSSLYSQNAVLYVRA